MKIVGLFSGIGGMEMALRRAGHETALLCEIDPAARLVLRRQFPDIEINADIRRLERLPRSDVVTAGFPCQNLSQAGRTEGIRGAQSGLVNEVFRLIDRTAPKPNWLLFENVPFMLRLDRGRAMRHIISNIEQLNYRWAYRIVDAKAFGLPQRRPRVIVLASRSEDPRSVLLMDNVSRSEGDPVPGAACGFYWTEGRTGLGWAINAIPPLKAGSAIGIAAPPAIWFPKDRRIATPDIRDAERLQGFPTNWTKPADELGLRNQRWRLIGNAISIPVMRWVGQRLAAPKSYTTAAEDLPWEGGQWPLAAWGGGGKIYRSHVSSCPVNSQRCRDLAGFLRFPAKDLSARATKGFLTRALESDLKFDLQFLSDVEEHLTRVQRQ